MHVTSLRWILCQNSIFGQLHYGVDMTISQLAVSQSKAMIEFFKYWNNTIYCSL
jgi:hypothetical protein